MKFNAYLLLMLITIIVTIGCSSGNPPVNSQQTKIIAVLKTTTHPALDELETAYINKLSEQIKTDESLKSYTIERYNANGKAESAKSIAESFNNKNVSLILTIGTPASIAVSKTRSDVPFIYGAVADPPGAGLIPSERATGIQNAGENIVIKALEFIKKAFPNAKRIGTIYNPSEQNSVFVQNLIKTNAEKMGFELKQVTIDGGSQLAGITETLCDQVDVIYSANDNTVNAGVGAIVSVTRKKQKPFVIGDLSTLSQGPLFAIGLGYETMGKDLAEISYQILKGKKITDFPPQPAPNPQIWLNTKTQATVSYTFPDSQVQSLIDKSIQ